jgi:hypothetical protein
MYLDMTILKILIEEGVLSLGSLEFTQAVTRYSNKLIEGYCLGCRINLDSGVVEKSEIPEHTYKVCSEGFMELLDAISEIPADNKICGIKLLQKLYPGNDLKFYKELWETTHPE